MKELVQLEEEIIWPTRAKPLVDLPDELLSQAKKDGFADRYLSKLLAVPEAEIRARAQVPGNCSGLGAGTCKRGGEAFYYYSTYNAPDRTPSSSRRKVMVLGGGPNRIGQGIEFDYCCVHAAFA